MTERLNIPVYNFKTGDKKAFCFKNAIALDFERVENDREGKQILAEEIGHILTNSLCPFHYCGEALYRVNILKQECKARNFASRLQVPLCELKKAIEVYHDDYEIAEALNVDLDILSEAVHYYRVKGLL